MSLLSQSVRYLQALDSGFGVEPEQLAKHIEQYLLLLEKWNRVHNLTAIRNPQDMLVQHVMDSLAAVSHLQGPMIVDVGSGAGLPGIPIALAKPDWQVTLVESNQKKAAFLQQAKMTLELKNVEIMAQRIEQTEVKSVNTIISRAFSALGEFITLTQRWAIEANAGCRWVAMKAHCSAQERNQVQAPFAIEQTVTLQVPGLDAMRQLIIIKHRQS
ncbi:MAG: 16S rRNA (guanine(527)-N(7))-methyltransferase RsmG [Nitrosomonas sp.]|nr:MAG: 16S rRNA (guanine(527)-N(7))-methyltransferase RsmG [Nitrosomonas sp.]